MPTDWTEALDAEIAALQPLMVGIRRRMHALPEPSGEEFQTTVFLHQLLKERGLHVRLGKHQRGLIVDPPRPASGPRVGLRADIDALRIQDCKQVPYRSTVPHVMHACGHDAHTAIVAGASLAIQAVSERFGWAIPWRALFQPEEETGTGALSMIEAGALEGVGAMFAAHMDPSRPVGRVGVRAGVLTANCNDLHLRVTGRGGHAARPHESLDPIAASVQLLQALYLMIPRATNSQDPVVITIGRLHAGQNSNVIPEEAEIEGTLRTLDRTVRHESLERIRHICHGVSETTGCSIEVKVRAGSPSVVNDTALTEILRVAAAERLGAEAVDEIDRPSMGGEDFAYYQEHVPGAMFRLGSAPPGVTSPPLHSPAFDIDESSLAIGAGILGRAALSWTRNPSPEA